MPGQPDSLSLAVSRQLFRKAREDPPTARVVAKLFDADALLNIRITRWERWSGSRGLVLANQEEAETRPLGSEGVATSSSFPVRAFVRLDASLVDSHGNLLWKSSGREAVSTPRAQAADLDLRPGYWRRRDDTIPQDFRNAGSALVSRWGALLPPP